MDGLEPLVTPPAQTAAKRRTRTPGQTLTCGWCDQPITVRATGRTPKWCSDTCRHRAWETTRAAAAGRAAVTVVDRTIEVQVPVPVEVQVSVPTLPKGRGLASGPDRTRAPARHRSGLRPRPARPHRGAQHGLDAYARRPAVTTRQRTGRPW